MKGRLPTPGAAFALFIATLVLNVVVSGILFWISQDLGVLLAEPLAILLPTLLAVRVFDLDIRKTLRLELPSRADVAVALPLAFSLAVVNDQLTNLTNQVFPLNDEMQEALVRLLRAQSGWDWAVKILGIGVGAAVSEELLFRGFIQRSFEQGLARSPAIFMTSVLFALMHLIPQGIPSYAMAGIVLGVTALASGSILIPILVHFIYNMSAVALLSLADLETLGRPVWVPPGILIPGVLIFGLTFSHFARKAAATPQSLPQLPYWTPPASLEEISADKVHAGRVVPARRRLGWLAVGCAVAWGTVVILGLFTVSIYQVYSRQIHAVLIEALKEEVLHSLPEPHSEEAVELEEQFGALLDANRAGRVSLGQIASLGWTYSQARADGHVSEQELEALLAEMRSILRASAPVRRL